MSDALTAARMISTTLSAYQFADMFTAARARNYEAAEIAALQALVQRLANYGRYVEQQHNSLLAEAKKIDAQRCQQINAQLDEIAELRATVERLTSALTEQAKLNERNYDQLARHCDFIQRGYKALADKYGPPSGS